jgi:hemolysin-activating ACP:hemolysin acyltransferase
MGQAVWLMTVSKAHRDLRISEIEELVTPAVLLQQFKIYLKGKQPIAFLAWASVSNEIKARFDAGDLRLAPHEWRSGANIIIVDCVSPFAEREEIEKQFSETLVRQTQQ